jgi:hypothetical protein
MKLVAPDYYEKFKCIADKCKHSCCIGWEIDIDEDTMDLYESIDGEFGEKLLDYNSYQIQISYNDDIQRWECDAFDLEAEQYVFYPCVKVIDKDKTRFNEVAQLCAKLIEEKIKSGDKDEDPDDILIYFKEDDYNDFNK